MRTSILAVALVLALLAHPAGAQSVDGVAAIVGGRTVYDVKAGDTVVSIGARFGVARATLIEMNKLVSPHTLVAGQRLLVDNIHIAVANPQVNITINIAQRLLVLVEGESARSQESFGDAVAIIQFQRSVDSYAFQHRQVQRRLGEAADQKALAAAMRAARPSAADGDFFTQIIAAAFHARISTALRTQGCKTAALDGSASNEVPRVGALAIGLHPVPGCLLRVLPQLPEELEYRATGVVLVLIDTHAKTIVDVLHGAF